MNEARTYHLELDISELNAKFVIADSILENYYDSNINTGNNSKGSFNILFCY